MRASTEFWWALGILISMAGLAAASIVRLTTPEGEGTGITLLAAFSTFFAGSAVHLVSGILHLYRRKPVKVGWVLGGYGAIIILFAIFAGTSMM